MGGPDTPPAPADAGVDGFRYGSGPGRWVLLATILGSGLAGIDATVVNVALPAIGADFGVGFAALQATVTAYTLTLASLILLGGALGDRFGRRRVFVIGVIWFALASAVCGARARCRLADLRARPPGRRGRAADAGEPRDDPGVVRAGRPCPGHRCLVGSRWGGHCRRAVPRRMAHPRRVLAVGLLDQSAARARGRARRAAARARVAGPRQQRAGRRRRGRLGRRRAGRGDVRDHRRPGAGPVVVAGRAVRSRRPGGAGRVRRGRGS